MAVSMKMAVFWVVAPCRLVEFYHITWCYNTEEGHIQYIFGLIILVWGIWHRFIRVLKMQWLELSFVSRSTTQQADRLPRMGLCEFWGFHGGEDSVLGLSAWDILWSCRYLTNLSVKEVIRSSEILVTTYKITRLHNPQHQARMRFIVKMAVFWVVAPCRLAWAYRSGLHGATTQKTTIFIVTAVRISGQFFVIFLSKSWVILIQVLSSSLVIAWCYSPTCLYNEVE
jgi:hypothetical protein